MNLKAANEVLDQLAEQGVKTLCLCPGARNAPFVMILAKSQGFEVINFYDERCAGFFALGRSRRDQAPVAILTTSGTAVSELLSPVIEAFHSDLPLVVLSSDRPKRLRGSGAPQTIDQSEIFNKFVEKAWDISAGEDFEIKLSGRKPVHINLCFDEPLIDGVIPSDKIFETTVKSLQPQAAKPALEERILNQPLVMIGALNKMHRDPVEKFLSQYSVPIHAESLSGLKDSELLKPNLIKSGEKLASKLLKSGQVKSVLRIGDIPVGRQWRDLDSLDVPTLSLSDKDFPGTEKSELFELCNLIENPDSIKLQSWDWQEWVEHDAAQKLKVTALCNQFPTAEPSLMASLSEFIAKEDRVYLGNSLPVRIWDMVDQRHTDVFASRGVNGIDGQISTGLGLWQPGQKLWIILGDLTTLYDFSGLWLTELFKKLGADINLVVVNNKGGQIFSRIFNEELFVNQHDLTFKPMAEMWGWDYQLVTSKEQLKIARGLNFIEVLPSLEQSRSFWREYDELW